MLLKIIALLSAMIGIYVFLSGNQSIYDVKKDNSHIKLNKYLKNVDNLGLVEYINNLPKEMKEVHEGWNEDDSMSPLENEHALYIQELDFLKNVWLELAKFYQKEYFGGKDSKEFIKDYIEKKKEIFSAKYGDLGNNNTHRVVDKRVVYEIFRLIEDLVNNISDKNQKIDYLTWKDKWEEAIEMKYLELSVKEDELSYGMN